MTDRRVITWWGEGAERRAGVRSNRELRAIPERDRLLKVYCNLDRDRRCLVAVVRRGRPPVMVTAHGETDLETSREIVCRCNQSITMTDPARVKAELDPGARRPRSVPLARVSVPTS